MKFGHIGIKVIDIEQSINFYEEVLEAKIIKDYVYPESTSHLRWIRLMRK